jgi:cytochrome P450
MIAVILISVSAILAFPLTYFLVLFVQRQWLLRHFPGPLALPLIGNCYDINAMAFLRYLMTLRRKYGKVFTFFSFAKPYLVVCEPLAVRRILSDPKAFPKGSDYTEVFGTIFGQGITTSNGEKHKHDRAIFGKYFARMNLAKYVPTMNSVTKTALAQFINPTHGKDYISMNVEELFAKIALRTFGKFALSVDIAADPDEETRFCHMTSMGSNAVGSMIIFNISSWPIFPQPRLVKKARTYGESVCQKWIQERRALLAAGKGDDYDDCITAMIREQLSDKDMHDQIITLIAAGHDTTAFFLSYMVYLLGQHPEIQEKLYQSIVQHFGDREEVVADDFMALKYLQCVMKETLRYYAIIPNVTREAADTIVIEEANITIPKGTNVLIPIAILNRDPEQWEHPNEFRPERFEEKGNTDFTSAKDNFFPFGYGSR